MKEKFDHELREKVSSFWKKTAKQLMTLGIAAHLFLACSNENQLKTFTISPWETLIELTKNKLSLSEEQKNNNQIVMQIVKNIQEKNDIKNPDYIKVWDVILVDMDYVKKVSKKHEGTTVARKKENEIIKEKRETTNTSSYSNISNIKEFNESNDYLVVKLRRDKRIKDRIEKELKQGYSIKIPKERENRQSPALSIEEITKPNTILSNKLKGKKIIIDPGHGSMDIGAIGISQYGQGKEKVVVYEAPIVMDISYRAAKLIRSHGGEVVFTHYANRRDIRDGTDLPPVSKSSYKGNEVYQDIWHGENHEHPGNLFNQNNWLNKRTKIANKEKKSDLFVSFHADLLVGKGEKINDSNKVLSIKYHKNGKHGGKSQKLWEKLLKNGFEYSYNNKRASDVAHSCTHQNLYVLRENQHPALLVELGNMSEPNQAYYLRSWANRQKLAESFTQALIKSLN